jgi:predicted permease
MGRLWLDLRIALRGFRRTPAFVVAVLAILGLGIGMAVAMFATFQTVLLRRLPVEDQDRLAVLWPYHTPAVELSPPATDLPEIRRVSRTMHDMAGVIHWGASNAPFVDGDLTISLNQAEVTSNYFEVLGAQPILGRLLRPEDDASGNPRAMVISYGVWRTRFGGDPSVVGRRLLWPYARTMYTIVGVAPAGLDYPIGADCWTPFQREDGRQVLAVARLRPSATLEAARSEFFAIINRLKPEAKLMGATAQSLTAAVVGDIRPILTALSTAVALLLLIVCVNAGNLLLTRAALRTRELAVRRALGATYRDLVRQLVVESVLLAAAGGTLGLLGAEWLLRALVALAPSQLPRLDDIRLHGSLLGIAIGVTSFSVILFGVLPTLAAARGNRLAGLRSDVRSGSETYRRRQVRGWLVASQIALALVMLAGAGLLIRSLRKLERVELGYRSDHLSLVWFAWDATRYTTGDQMLGWGEQMEQRIRAFPGVTAVTPIAVPPFYGTSIMHASIEAEDRGPAAEATAMDVPVEAAGSQYFRTFGIPMLQGRSLLESDREGAPFAVVISQSVAQRFWPGQVPLGKRVRVVPLFAPTGERLTGTLYDWRTVVGVVPDTRFRSLQKLSPAIYLPWRQFEGWQAGFAVRSQSDAAGLTSSLRHAIKEVDPTLVLAEVKSMDQLLGGPLGVPRLSTLLSAGFGVVALVLAIIGLYGVMSATVREQTRAIGIRMALGATPGQIREAVLRQALVIVLIGSGVGLAGALVATRLLRTLLFDLSPTDPATLAAVSCLLLIVAVLAAYLPARRATRIDPVQALRAE